LGGAAVAVQTWTWVPGVVEEFGSSRHLPDCGMRAQTGEPRLSGWFRDDGPITPEQVAEEYTEFAVRIVGAG
jgi:hypothetical protein